VKSEKRIFDSYNNVGTVFGQDTGDLDNAVDIYVQEVESENAMFNIITAFLMDQKC